MKKLIFATSNSWKFNQAYEYFKGKGIELEQISLDLPESREEDVLKIAKEKVSYAYKQIGKPLFVNDTGHYIKALQDFPKSYVKFAEKYIGAEGVLKLLEGEKDRRWEVPNVIYYKDASQERVFMGTLKGTIVDYLGNRRDTNIRDFDRIFVPDGYTKTFSEFTEEDRAEYDEKVWKPTVFDEFIDWFLSHK